MSPRYAVYYAPQADSDLWRMASAWLGRDAYAGRAVERPEVSGLVSVDLEALTADPRGYGFHATLKAPFELASDRSEGELIAFVESFSQTQTPFEAAIAPAALGRFLAFRLQSGEAEMAALHSACVRDFDAFRAPLSAFDLARRRKAPLTPEQDQRLVAWGYPYVFEDFRFHMTLTNAIADAELREQVLGVLAKHFAPVAGPHRFDGVAVFRQDDREAPFNILTRAAFRSPSA